MFNVTTRVVEGITLKILSFFLPPVSLYAVPIVVEYVKKSSQNTAYSMFERNTEEYVKFPINKPEKN